MIDKTTLKQEADKLFASTSYEVLWGSPAGEFFTTEKTGSLSLKEGEKLIKFEKTEKKELNANDTIAKIKAATSLEAIKEFENDERKSVKSVYDWKAKQLIELIPVVGATVANGNEDTDTQK
jgi:hypothetical protein